MGTPATGQARPREDLAILAKAYGLELMLMAGLIAHRIFPNFFVSKRQGIYQAIPLQEFLKKIGGERADGAAYQRGDWKYTNKTWRMKKFGLEEVDNEDDTTDFEVGETEEINVQLGTIAVLQQREVGAINKSIGAASGLATTPVTGTAWSDPAGARPLADNDSAQSAFRDASGFLPNLTVMSYDIFKEAMRTDEIKEAFKYTAPVEGMTLQEQAQTLATYFKIPQVLVAGAQGDTAGQNLPASLQNLFPSDEVGYYYVDAAGNPKMPTFGHSFRLSEEAGGGIGGDPAIEGIIVDEYGEPQTETLVTRVKERVAQEVKWSQLGRRLTGV